MVNVAELTKKQSDLIAQIAQTTDPALIGALMDEHYQTGIVMEEQRKEVRNNRRKVYTEQFSQGIHGMVLGSGVLDDYEVNSGDSFLISYAYVQGDETAKVKLQHREKKVKPVVETPEETTE